MNELEWWAQVVITLGAAAIAASGSWALLRPSKAKLRAEETEIITDTALRLIEPLRMEVSDLRERMAVVERENAILKVWAKMLSEQVYEHGGVPIPFETAEQVVFLKEEGKKYA